MSEDDIAAAMWLVYSFVAISMLIAGDSADAAIVSEFFKEIGWNELPDPARRRLVTTARWLAHHIENKQ